jgi:hypothetical protein
MMGTIIDLPVRPNGRAHQHREAFCLMWYACECGHQERIWNSRDGVTPFRTLCPSCGRAGMQHERWDEDACEPNHRPRAGQRVWVSMTVERATQMVDAVIASCRRPIDNDRRTAMIASVFGAGTAPDLVVWDRSKEGARAN